MINGKEEKNLIVALDVGTSKIVVIVAELQEDGILKIIGLGPTFIKRSKKGSSDKYRFNYSGHTKGY
jgi:cell division protein FtsA